MKAYEAAIRATAAPHAPWFVVPADNRWYARTVIAAAVVDAMSRIDLHYPRLDKAALAELAVARKSLLAEREK